MQPVICFYSDSEVIYSEKYELLSCDKKDLTYNFLNDINKVHFNKLKVIKINYTAFNSQVVNHKNPYIKTNLIDVFILDQYEIIKNVDLMSRLQSYDYSVNLKFEPLVKKPEFKNAVLSIKEDINNGRFYQINYTAALRSARPLNFSSLNYFGNLIQNVQCPYKAYLPLENADILCLSPELFLYNKNEYLKTQPIKGTLIKGKTIDDLSSSNKEHAELSMIVDLLRNDLNSLSCEKYKDHSHVNFHRKIMNLGYTSHTYSEIEIKTSKNLPDILTSVFPGGSISGCPKIESLKKINEIETYDRDFYTGSIGWWLKNDFMLNIAIRSLISDKQDIYYYTGCGIVYESEPDKEWNEFLTKCSFLPTTTEFKIIDTFKFNNNNISYIDLHIDRTYKALKTLDPLVNYQSIKEMYRKILDHLKEKDYQEPQKVRVCFDQSEFEISSIENFNLTFEPVRLDLLPWGTQPHHLYKTTDRSLWNALLKQKHNTADDVLVYNSKGNIVECSIYNVFYKINNQLYTPPLSDGCLDGVYRRHLIETGIAIERSISLNEIKNVEIYVGNSVREMLKAQIIAL